MRVGSTTCSCFQALLRRRPSQRLERSAAGWSRCAETCSPVSTQMLLLINRRACHMFLLMLQERVIIDGLQYDAVRREIASFKLPHRAWDKLNRMGQLSTCSLPDGAWARSLLAGKSALQQETDCATPSTTCRSTWFPELFQLREDSPETRFTPNHFYVDGWAIQTSLREFEKSSGEKI